MTHLELTMTTPGFTRHNGDTISATALLASTPVRMLHDLMRYELEGEYDPVT